MPNWANGIITVSGNPENIKKFCQLFIFEDHEQLKPKKYFARSFIHTTWKFFEEEMDFKEEIDGWEFEVDNLKDFIQVLKTYKSIHLNYFDDEDDLDIWIRTGEENKNFN